MLRCLVASRRRHTRCSGVSWQAEDGIRDAQESRGLGDVYKRQTFTGESLDDPLPYLLKLPLPLLLPKLLLFDLYTFHLLFFLYNHMCGAHIVLCYVAMIRARLLEFKQRTRRFCIFNFWVDIREEPLSLIHI